MDHSEPGPDWSRQSDERLVAELHRRRKLFDFDRAPEHRGKPFRRARHEWPFIPAD